MGAVASVVGLFLGLLLGKGLFALFDAVGFTLPNQGLTFETRTIIVSLLVGVLVTVLASLRPALRATRVPPIAAVREGATLPQSRFARFRSAGAALTAVMVIAQLKYPQAPTQAQQYLVNFATFAFAWFLGLLQRSRRQHTAELEALNRQLAAERERRAQLAVAEERSRIARELHDVIAHAVSVMVVQAGAARRVAAAQPDRAQEVITSIESTGRQALHEMRRLVACSAAAASPPAWTRSRG